MLLNYDTEFTADVIDKGQGRPLLLIHSAGRGAAKWGEFVKTIGDEYWCLAPNLRGYGRSSPWPNDRPAEISAELALLEAVVAHAGAPLALVGHSMGAWLALELALRH